MSINSAERVTIDKVDQTGPIDEWKPLVADLGRRRHLSYTMDFDSRAYVFDEPGEGWAEETKQLHLKNRERVVAGLARQFGEDHLDRKVGDFVAIGFKPFSILSYHNQFFEQARQSFVIGAYYPALIGACALGERILNHLVLDLRDFYKSTPQYKDVYRKKSFDNWQIPINTLETWQVLLPKAAAAFRALETLRHRSIHFNAGTYATLREDALAAILHMREIIEQQFPAFADRPWFIPGTSGHVFIRRDWETNPFVKTFYLPTCPLVGPYFAISFDRGLVIHDHTDYGEGSWSDEEFATTFEARQQEQLVVTDKRD